MIDSLTSFLQRPTAKRYRELAGEWIACDEREQERILAVNARLAELFEHGRFEEVLREGREIFPGGVLSLRLNRLMGQAAMLLERREALLHRFAFDACLRAIELTGRGTKAAPWSVAFVSDEYEFLRARDLKILRQSLVENDGVLCDVLMLENEREAWFQPLSLAARVPAKKSRKRTAPAAAGRKR